VSPVDLMLLGTVLLWALNITVTRYVLTHGWRPLSYGTIRYFAATALFWGFTYSRERSFRVRWRDVRLVGLAALLIFLNQLGFVYSIDLTSASTVALILGTTPIFVGLTAAAVGLERMGRMFWFAAATSFVGVGFVASGTGGFSTNVWGDLLALATAATWAAYSVTIAPLMRRYSPFRISALVLGVGWIPLAIVGSSQTVHQTFHFSDLVWVCFGYAVIGPLFLTNILWFTAIDRVGPSRASLFANLQPFFAVVIALLLLSEHLNRWEIVGGVAIFTAIALERMRAPRHEAKRPRETDVATEAPRA
jgi:drug/metabolite transporter (DMT)-like permease